MGTRRRRHGIRRALTPAPRSRSRGSSGSRSSYTDSDSRGSSQTDDDSRSSGSNGSSVGHAENKPAARARLMAKLMRAKQKIFAMNALKSGAHHAAEDTLNLEDALNDAQQVAREALERCARLSRRGGGGITRRRAASQRRRVHCGTQGQE